MVGAMALLRDLNKNSALFFRLVDLANGGRIVWEQEVYLELQYNKDRPYFHSFAGDSHMIGFSFADEQEAQQFHDLAAKKISQAATGQAKTTTAPRTFQLSPELPPRNTGEAPQSAPNAAAPTEKGGWFSSLRRDGSSKEKKTDAKKSRKVGAPSNFRHLAHIGFDPVTGFDIHNIPPEWKMLFDKAGVTQEQLQNKETAKFIVDFVQSQGGPASATTSALTSKDSSPAQLPANPVRQGAPPPPPPSKVSRGPPPVPPARTGTMRPGTENPVRNSVMVPTSSASAPAPPPPPSSNSTPNLFSSEQAERRAPAVQQPKGIALPSVGPERSDLMASIRQGGISMLKPVQASENSSSPPPSEDPTDAMASLLAKALADRNRKIAHSDSEDDDNDAEDDEW